MKQFAQLIVGMTLMWVICGLIVVCLKHSFMPFMMVNWQTTTAVWGLVIISWIMARFFKEVLE